MKQIEKLRTSKPETGGAPWVWLVGAGCWLIALVINIFSDKSGIAAINAACLALFVMNYFSTTQNLLNKELLKEIDDLRNQLNQRQNKQDSQPEH
jgi:hypothetical protein